MLYSRHCAACHGDDGYGGKAYALNKKGLLLTVDLDYLINSIRYGRPLSGCPSFEGKLSAEKIKAIATFIKGWQRGELLEAPDYAVLPAKSDRGEFLFNICGACHGLKAEGAMGPPLLDPGFLKSASDTVIRRTIMYGRPGTPMKAFLIGKVIFPLTPEDIDKLISYLRYRQLEMEKQE